MHGPPNVKCGNNCNVMWQYTVYVAVYMWQYICGSYMWQYICGSIYVAVHMWQYICGSIYVAVYTTIYLFV